MKPAAGLERLGRRLGRWIGHTVEFALPSRCGTCGAPAAEYRPLCTACFSAIPRWSTVLCARCLQTGREPVGCRRHPAAAFVSAWLYDERAAAVIHAIKFSGFRRLAAALAPEVARVLPASGRWDALVVVPLHALRRRERGYNQVEPLARALSADLGVPWLDGALERVRYTAPQTGLHGPARRRNLHGAFRVRVPSWFDGRDVLVLDDVVTTGATLTAAMDAVRGAGGRPMGAVLAWAQ